MTKKDYIIIADCINDVLTEDNRPALLDVINTLSGRFIIDNPRFDKQRFMSRCLTDEL